MGVISDALARLARAEDRNDYKAALYAAIPNLIGKQFTPRTGVTITIMDAGIERRMLKFVFRVVVGGKVVLRATDPANPFYFYNPPVLVPDPAGDIVKTWTDRQGTVHEARFREDVVEALRQVVLDALKDAIL